MGFLLLWLSFQNSPKKIQAGIQCSQQVINIFAESFK